MVKKPQIEQRAKLDPGFSDRRGLAFRLPRSVAWSIAIVGVALTGVMDLVTADTVWLGPAYMVFIGLAAWALGFGEAVCIMAACAAFSLVANSDAMYPYGGSVTALDFAMRIPPILAIIALLAHARRACETEWKLARTDQLTGALNRKAFFELAGTITESKTWHVLAYADLDGLKRLNDAEGHALGDSSLRAFAAHVRSAIRKDDIFARIGGDEFLVYLAVRDAQAGLAVANRLHRAMNSAATDSANALHCSVGALILAPGPRSIDRELRVADELMYEAKQSGSALTVATVRETDGELSASGRWLQTGTLLGDVPGTREFRATPRGEDGQPGAQPETRKEKRPPRRAA